MVREDGVRITDEYVFKIVRIMMAEEFLFFETVEVLQSAAFKLF